VSTDPGLHRRRPIRIPEYDYTAPGRYYVTICVRNRECLLGRIRNGGIHLNELGRIVQRTWDELPRHYSNIFLDAFVIMPNHVHGIIGITDCGAVDGADSNASVGTDSNAFVGAGSVFVGAGFKPAPTTTPLSEIIRGFKTFSARMINTSRTMPGVSVWQRNYYEHVIRNERDLGRIRQYIADNPAQWELDKNNPRRNS
jgi:REP element-mobilizing transposase RayT